MIDDSHYRGLGADKELRRCKELGMFDSFVDENAVCPQCNVRQDSWQTKDLQALGESWTVGDFFQYHYLRPLRKREKERIIKEGRGIVNARGQLIAPLFAHGEYMSEQPIISNGEIKVHTSCDNRKCGTWLEALAVIRRGKFVGIRAVRSRQLSDTTRPKARKRSVMIGARESLGRKEGKILAHRRE